MESKAFARDSSRYTAFSISRTSGGVGKIGEQIYARERDALTAKIREYNVLIAESVSDGRPMSALAYCRWKNHYQNAFESRRNEFIEANLALQFLAFSKWVKRQGRIPARQGADEILLNAHNSLVRAAELFDPAKGRFSTYCVRALLNSFDRGNQKEERVLSRMTSLGGVHVSPVNSPYEEAVAAEERRYNQNVLKNALKCLTPRERELIEMRFGVDSGNERLTLRDIGNSWDLTHQRAWQIEKETLAKLRGMLEDSGLTEYDC